MAGARKKIGVLQVVTMVAVGLLGLIAVFVVVPPFAYSLGMNERQVNYAVAGAAFLVVVAAVRWAKSLTKK